MVDCPKYPETYLPIEKYWEFLQINEIAGYGIRNYPTTEALGMGCGDYWDYKDRYYLLSAIQKAEQRLEADRFLGFPLSRKYYSGRQLSYSWPVYLGKYVRGVGVETNTFLDTVSLTLSNLGVINDPVEFTIPVTFTDIDELIITFPDTLCKIRPSSVVIVGGIATVQIPRARLLKPDYHKNYKNDNERPNYTNDSYFLSEVDVYRNYLNTTTGANLVWWRHQGQVQCVTNVVLSPCDSSPSGACADVRQLACPYIPNQREGFVQLEPATYSSGFSKASYAVKRLPDGVELAYMRGYYDRYDEWTADIIRAVIAIAHNNMPQNYCSCDVQTLYYQNDTKPIEPPVRLALGMSTWGNYEAEQIIREFDQDRNSHRAGML